MIHNEHFRKADELYEIRHDNDGHAIHVVIKDGEAIIYPTAYDMVSHWVNGEDVERFYISEDRLDDIYGGDDYDYYTIKSLYNGN